MKHIHKQHTNLFVEPWIERILKTSEINKVIDIKFKSFRIHWWLSLVRDQLQPVLELPQTSSASELPSSRSLVQVRPTLQPGPEAAGPPPIQRITTSRCTAAGPPSTRRSSQHTGSSEVINNDSIYLTLTQTPARLSWPTHVRRAHSSQRSLPAAADLHQVTSGSEAALVRQLIHWKHRVQKATKPCLYHGCLLLQSLWSCLLAHPWM